MIKSRGRLTADGMLRVGTPVEHYPEYDLWVKREDLACPLPGPPFSKARGVYAHIAKRSESAIGVLDTVHSQAGWAVARACQVLGKTCINFYPKYVVDAEAEVRAPQQHSSRLGAELWPLPAGRSCILYHAARKATEAAGGYMMPNALKMEESVEETAKEVPADPFDVVIVPCSSATIAAGVVRGTHWKGYTLADDPPLFALHLGYSRSHDEVVKYVVESSGVHWCRYEVVDERYAYKDKARPGETPPWPCNEYYDLKAFRWYLANRDRFAGSRVLLWNVG